VRDLNVHRAPRTKLLKGALRVQGTTKTLESESASIKNLIRMN
jgi:hypothetical protein